MKDTDKVELTVGNIKAAAEKCGTAKEVLKELFPEVFKESPGWEDVTDGVKFVYYANAKCVTQLETRGGYDCPFKLVFNDDSGRVDEYRENYRLGDGRIWRKKSE